MLGVSPHAAKRHPEERHRADDEHVDGTAIPAGPRQRGAVPRQPRHGPLLRRGHPLLFPFRMLMPLRAFAPPAFPAEIPWGRGVSLYFFFGRLSLLPVWIHAGGGTVNRCQPPGGGAPNGLATSRLSNRSRAGRPTPKLPARQEEQSRA